MLYFVNVILASSGVSVDFLANLPSFWGFSLISWCWSFLVSWSEPLANVGVDCSAFYLFVCFLSGVFKSSPPPGYTMSLFSGNWKRTCFTYFSIFWIFLFDSNSYTSSRASNSSSFRWALAFRIPLSLLSIPSCLAAWYILSIFSLISWVRFLPPALRVSSGSYSPNSLAFLFLSSCSLLSSVKSLISGMVVE